MIGYSSATKPQHSFDPGKYPAWRTYVVIVGKALVIAWWDIFPATLFRSSVWRWRHAAPLGAWPVSAFGAKGVGHPPASLWVGWTLNGSPFAGCFALPCGLRGGLCSRWTRAHPPRVWWLAL